MVLVNQVPNLTNLFLIMICQDIVDFTVILDILLSQQFVKIEWASCIVLILVDALKGRVKLMGKSDPVVSLCSGVTLSPIITLRDRMS